MSDWFVVIKPKGGSGRTHILVEDVESATEAERFALLRLGVDPLLYEARVEFVNDRVSRESPKYSFKELTELYGRVLEEKEKLEKKLETVETESKKNLRRAETAEGVRQGIHKRTRPLETQIEHLRISKTQVERQRDDLVALLQAMRIRLMKVMTESLEMEKMFNTINMTIHTEE